MSSEDIIEQPVQTTRTLPSLNVTDSEGNQVALAPARPQSGLPLHHRPQSSNESASPRRVREPHPNKDPRHGPSFIPVTKPRMKVSRKIMYAIGILIILAGIAVLLYFLITGSKDLDSSLKNIKEVTSEDLAKLKDAHDMATNDLVEAENARWLAKESHEQAVKDLGDLDRAYQITSATQKTLYGTLDKISKAAHVLGDSIAPPASEAPIQQTKA